MNMPSRLYIVERNDKRQSIHTSFSKKTRLGNALNASSQKQIWMTVAKVFLPTGYPDTVTDDYLRYQILNGLQAFCSTLATLISSRGVLEGVGVGDASASATSALLLTTLQDIFGRLTTVLSAYYLGSTISTEAKRYRFVADIFNNSAIVIDTYVPLLKQSPLFASVPNIHVIALCLSGSLQALSGIVGYGSKVSISSHFANPENGKGDIADLATKDASRVTVIRLAGLLLGTMIVPYLNTRSSTIITVFTLLIIHLFINYCAVRALNLRTLNRQRAVLAWTHYRQYQGQSQQPKISPASIARLERIFEGPGVIRDPETCTVIGRCKMDPGSVGTSAGQHIPVSVANLFAEEQYILLISLKSTSKRPPFLQVDILLKEGYAKRDTLKAWVHAAEMCLVFAELQLATKDRLVCNGEEHLISEAYSLTNANFAAFVDHLTELGWNLDVISILTGPPKRVIVTVGEDEGPVGQRSLGEKKND